MSPSCNSIYDLFAKTLTVKDVGRPIIVRVSPEETFENVCEAWDLNSGMDLPCIVSDANKTYGVIWEEDDIFWERPVSGTAVDFAKPIPTENMISDSFPLIDLPNLFIENTYFFVLTGTQITHIVEFEDFNSLTMKACLFTLFLEVEFNLLRILRQQRKTDLEGAFNKLSSNRLYQITDLYNKKQKNSEKKTSSNQVTNFDGKSFSEEVIKIDDFNYKSLLGGTNFIDKAKLFWNFPQLIDQLPFVSRTEYDNFFFKVQDLRNRIAHSDPIIDYPHNPQKFSDFINKLRQVVEIISSMEIEEFYIDW